MSSADVRATLQPLAQWPADARRRIQGLLCDIDGTLTDADGRLPATSLAAMERLRAAGLKVVPVTGRPAGWCDHFARMWPVDAVVGENGAFWMARVGGRLTTVQIEGGPEAVARTERLAAAARRVLREVPGCAVSSDQPYRLADLAIDFAEDVPRLPPQAVDRIVAVLRDEGLTAQPSAGHVNAWFGGHDKVSTARACLQALWGVEAEALASHWTFIGDAPNDAPMFASFPDAVGVANVRDSVGRIDALPAWVTQGAGATGFVELVDALLEARTTIGKQDAVARTSLQARR